MSTEQPFHPDPAPAIVQRSGLAVAALVCGLFAPFTLGVSHVLAVLLGVAAVVCAVLALREIGKGAATGRGMAVWGLILGAFFALVAIGSWSPNKPATVAASTGSTGYSAPAQAATPTVISLKAMGDDFERNQVAAERKWGGQFVQFTAPVGNINSSSVSFTDATSKFSFTQVSCRVADESAVMSLAKGQNATVRGVVGSDQLLGVIGLNDCEVLGK